MKMSYLLAAALILFSLVSVSFAAESVEIRSEILYYDSNYGNEIYPDNWAVLYYDLKNNVQTERIYLSSYSNQNEEYLDPGHLEISYFTSPVFQKFEYNWSVPIEETYSEWNGEDYEYNTISVPYPAGFAVLGFFGEPYVALNSEDLYTYPDSFESHFIGENLDFKANKIARLVMNDDSKYVLRTGETINLGDGYSLVVNQIDLKGNKVYLELTKDGNNLADSIVNTNGSNDWVYNTTVLGDKDRQVLRVHVKDAFQGVNNALVEIDGLWLVDYLNAFEVKSDVDYGKWNATDITSEHLVYVVEDVALSSNATANLGKNWSVKVQDGFEIPPENAWSIDGYEYNNRFYLFREYTESGKYEIRSSVSSDEYTYQNFAAFYYDLDKNLATEFLRSSTRGHDSSYYFEKENLDSFSYMTTYVHTDYEYLSNAGFDENENLISSWDSGYNIMGYFGEKYVPLNVVDQNGFYVHGSTKLDKFAPLVMDDDAKYTLKTKGWVELGNNYSLYVSQIDVKGNQVYLELHKDGGLVNSSIVTTEAGNGSGNWIYKDTILNVKDVQLLRVHVKDVFKGSDDFVEIDAVWLTDFNNVTDLEADDEVGLLVYDGLYQIDDVNYPIHSDYSAFLNLDAESVLVFHLKNNLTLSDEMDQIIANNLSLKVYEGDSFNPPVPTLLIQPMSYNPYNGYRYYFYVTEEIGNLSSGDGDGGNGEDDGNDDGSDDNSGDPDNPDNEDSPSDLTNGFGAIVLGLLLLLLLIVAAYLYRRYMSRKAQTANQNETDEK